MARATKSSVSSFGTIPCEKNRRHAAERVPGRAVFRSPTRYPVSSKVSRTAASARPRAFLGRTRLRPCCGFRGGGLSESPRADRRHRAHRPERRNAPEGKCASGAARPSTRGSCVCFGGSGSARLRPSVSGSASADPHPRRGMDFRVPANPHRLFGLGREEGRVCVLAGRACRSSSPASSKRSPPVRGAASARRTRTISPKR